MTTSEIQNAVEKIQWAVILNREGNVLSVGQIVEASPSCIVLENGDSVLFRHMVYVVGSVIVLGIIG